MFHRKQNAKELSVCLYSGFTIWADGKQKEGVEVTKQDLSIFVIGWGAALLGEGYENKVLEEVLTILFERLSKEKIITKKTNE